jgi:hypothetical protein
MERLGVLAVTLLLLFLLLGPLAWVVWDALTSAAVML